MALPNPAAPPDALPFAGYPMKNISAQSDLITVAHIVL